MDDFVKAAEIGNELEAGLLESLLVEENIPHIMRSYYDAVYDGVFQVQKGWGCVQAPVAHHGRIHEMLRELRVAAHEEDADDASS